MWRCVVCEMLKDEVVFTKADFLGGSEPELPVLVCEECYDNVERMKEETGS